MRCDAEVHATRGREPQALLTENSPGWVGKGAGGGGEWPLVVAFWI